MASSTERSRKRRARMARERSLELFGVDLAELTVEETVAVLKISDGEMHEYIQPMKDRDWERLRFRESR